MPSPIPAHQYSIEILRETDISWQLQNKIHEILNIAFEGLSNKFLAKTYGHIRPTERAIGSLDNKLVAHLGITPDYLLLNNQPLEIACLGLWASLRKGWASKVMEVTLNHLKSQGTLLAIGMSNSDIILNRVLPSFHHIILDLPIYGNNFSSKPTDKAIFFPISISNEKLDEIISSITQQQAIFIQGEPF